MMPDTDCGVNSVVGAVKVLECGWTVESFDQDDNCPICSIFEDEVMEKLKVEKEEGVWRIVRYDRKGERLGAGEGYATKAEAKEVAERAEDAVYEA